MKKTTLLTLSTILTSFIFTSVSNADQTKNTGWNGSLILGALKINYASNLVAGIKIVELTDSTISSLSEEPDSKSTPSPLVSLNAQYNFNDSQYQFFMGDSIDGQLGFDANYQVGLRLSNGDFSKLEFAYLFTPISTEVWSDPYVTNKDRNKTDRATQGLRLGYFSIAGSAMDIELSYRQINVSNEQSGLKQLNLSTNNIQLLNRDGNETRYKLRYNAKLGQHNWIPEITYINFDGDGKAMAYDALKLKLTHNYNTQRYSSFSSIFLYGSEYIDTNPIYNKLREDKKMGLAFTVIDREFFSDKEWSAVASVIYVKQDSNINFYSSYVTIVSLGAMTIF